MILREQEKKIHITFVTVYHSFITLIFNITNNLIAYISFGAIYISGFHKDPLTVALRSKIELFICLLSTFKGR